MRLFILETTNALVQGPGNLNLAPTPTVKLSTQELLEVQYLDAFGQPKRRPEGRLPYLGVKIRGHYDEPTFVVCSPALARPAAEDGFYTGVIDCRTEEFFSALGNVPGSTAIEADDVALMGEVVYPINDAGDLARSRTFALTGLNRVVTLAEGLPTPATPNYAALTGLLNLFAAGALLRACVSCDFAQPRNAHLACL